MAENEGEMKINVLGTAYEIIVKKHDEDEAFKRKEICGYCDGYKKQLVVCDPATFEGWENEDAETVSIAKRETIRHEIVHAFLEESGLASSTLQYDGGWAKCEEMIDWIAMQGPKIYAAWKEAEAV